MKIDGSDFEVVTALAVDSRFRVSGASGGGRWLAVLLGFFLALASTLEAIPTRNAAEYLEIGLTTEHTENTEVSWKVYGPDMSATTGRLASAVHAGAGGATVNYTGYDANGNLLSLNEGGNGTITRTYDGLNRVNSYTEAGKTIGYRYYASGKLAKAIYPGGTETGVGHIEYTYNADGRLYQVIDRLSSTSGPRTTTYVWNTDGRLATVTRPNGTVRTISYDAAGRPSGISDAGIVWGIGYYASDDIATLDVTPAVPPQSLAAVPATQMTFDAANRLATFNGQSVTHDADGNMVSGPLPATGAMGNYTYDSRNRLTGAGGFAYRYNAEGNRVGLTSANETTTLTVDPQGALPKVLERVKNGIRTRYVYGAGLQYEVNDAGSATYYHYDQSGNTAALTNQAGAIIERVVYSPYGTIRYRQSNFDTPFLYGGFFGVMTDANGLINMRARYYNPLTMRFLNSDPAMDGLNWYAYANGNPIGRVDPTGLATLVLWGTNYSHPEDPDYFKNQATAWSNSSGIKDAVVRPGGSTADWNAAIGSVGIVDAIVYIGHSGALSGPTKLREGVDVNHVSQPNFTPNASITLYGCSTGSVSPGDTSNSSQTYANRFGVPTHGSTTGVSFGLPVPLTNIDLNPGYVRQSGTISPATMKTYFPKK